MFSGFETGGGVTTTRDIERTDISWREEALSLVIDTELALTTARDKRRTQLTYPLES
jgi:hypothetical protein